MTLRALARATAIVSLAALPMSLAACGRAPKPQTESVTPNPQLGSFRAWLIDAPGTNNRAAPGPGAGGLAAQIALAQGSVTAAAPAIDSVHPATKGGTGPATTWWVYQRINANVPTYTITVAAGNRITDWQATENAVADYPPIPTARPLDLTIESPTAVLARNGESVSVIVFDLRVCESDLDVGPYDVQWSSPTFQALPWTVLVSSSTPFAPGASAVIPVPSTSITRRYLYKRQLYDDGRGSVIDAAQKYDLAALAGVTANLFEVYPDAAGTGTSHTTRMSLGTGVGELLYDVTANHHAGIGDSGAGCELRSFRFVTQDQNQATPETCRMILRAETAAGTPDLTAPGLLFRSGAIGLFGSGGGVGALMVTVSFGIPLDVPCLDGFLYGIEVGAAPGWPATDGQSVHMAGRAPLATITGDIPRSTAPINAWYVSGATASRAASGRAMRFAGGVESPVLDMGCIDPGNPLTPRTSFGEGGLYPDVKNVGSGRDDGIAARILDSVNDGGVTVLLLSLGGATPGVSLPGVEQRLWLNLAFTPITAGIAAISGGVASVTVVPPGGVPASVIGASVDFQAATLSAGATNLRLTNLQSVSF
ncbi:MAG: hypothetical protein HZB39_20970 [Planctomycetes bacterium]|nr:hypothetical protein [Planctomycetota bacterium]